MEKKKKLDTQKITDQLTVVAQQLKRYSFVLFLVFVVAVYGFVVLRINTLDSAQPSTAAVSTQSNPIQSARIDPTVVKQLEALRDNSVGVQTLFEQARNNPFQD